MKQETIGSKGTVPGFRPLIGSERWHKDTFPIKDLDGGYRPLLEGEEIEQGDQGIGANEKYWTHSNHLIGKLPQYNCRTKRPLPPPAVETLEAHGHIWYKHTPGDECPVEPDAKITVIHGDFDPSMLTYDSPTQWSWSKFKQCGANVIGYRFPDYPAVHTTLQHVEKTEQSFQHSPTATIPAQFSTEQRLTSLYNDWCFLPPETVAECIADVASVLYPTDAERCEAAFQRWWNENGNKASGTLLQKQAWNVAWSAAKESK